MSFLQYLEGGFRERGYRVYSKHLPALENGPPDWQGVLPDLVAERPPERIAVFVETRRTLADPLAPDRWRHSSQVNQAALQLHVYHRSDRKLLREILEREGIAAEVGMVRRRTLRRRVSTGPPSGWVRIAIGLLVILALCYLLVLFVSVLYDYRADFYEPRDMEREESPP